MGLDHISLGVFFGRIWKSCNENPWPSLIISSLVFDFIKGKRGLGSCGFPWMDRKELASPRHPAIPPEFWCSRYVLGGCPHVLSAGVINEVASLQNRFPF